MLFKISSILILFALSILNIPFIDAQKQKVCKLHGGSIVSERMVQCVYGSSLKQLYLSNRSVFREFIAKCKNPKHTLLDDAKTIIEDFELINDGIIEDVVRTIALASITESEGEGPALSFIDENLAPAAYTIYAMIRLRDPVVETFEIEIV